MNSSSVARLSIPVGIVAALGHVVIGWHSVGSLDTLWDEKVDLAIAVGLRDDPLCGGQQVLDASQTRLPMYASAVAFRLTGRDDLRTSRGVSLAAAAVTIVATAALGRHLFGPWTGALAAVLLAFSPYFLAYSRVAMTEGDVFFACTATIATWAFARYQTKPTARRWLAAAVCLALALGAKVFAIALVPVFACLTVTASPAESPGNAAPRAATKHLHVLLGVMLVLIACIGVLAFTARNAAMAGRVAARLAQERAAIGGWMLLLGLWLYSVIFVVRHRVLARSRFARFVGMMILAIVTFFVVMPVHLLQHDFARTVLRRIVQWDGRAPLAFCGDHLRLYTGVLLIKATVPLGAVTCAGLIFGVTRWRRHAGWRVCVSIVLAYVACLCLLPLRQTFYLMGVYPLLMIVTAAFAVHLAAHRLVPLPVGAFRGGQRIRAEDGPARLDWRETGGLETALARPREVQVLGGLRDQASADTAVLRQSQPGTVARVAATLWIAVVGCMLANLAWNVRRAFPYYHLFGYELVGDRWFGAESRGYRNLIQTPSDGVESLIRWCNTDARVRPGARVVSFLWEEAIIEGTLPSDPRYVFVPRGVSPNSDDIPPPPLIDNADFVLVHINNLLGYGDRPPDWPPQEVLQARFEVIHAVRRGLLEVAWVYARRSPAGSGRT